MARHSYIFALTLCIVSLAVSCRHSDPESEDLLEISISLLTKATGSDIEGIDPNLSWGLYVFESGDHVVLANEEMVDQVYDDENAQRAHFRDDASDTRRVAIRSNFVLAGYYPYLDNANIVTNSHGHSAILRTLATKFDASADPFFAGIASYSRYSSASDYVVEIAPKTSRLWFQVVGARDIDVNDYKILSIGIHHEGESASTATSSSYLYDIYHGELTDIQIPKDGHTYVFTSADGVVRPSPYGTSNLPVILDMEVFPEEGSHFNEIYMEMKYQLLVNGEWKDITATLPMESIYLSDGWRAGWIYKYRINVGRHDVEFYDVEIVPWVFDPEKDQFSGIIE